MVKQAKVKGKWRGGKNRDSVEQTCVYVYEEGEDQEEATYWMFPSWTEDDSPMSIFEDGEGVSIILLNKEGKSVKPINIGFYDMMDCNEHLHCLGKLVFYESDEDLIDNEFVENVDRIMIRSTVDDEVLCIPSVELNTYSDGYYGTCPAYGFIAKNISSMLFRTTDDVAKLN